MRNVEDQKHSPALVDLKFSKGMHDKICERYISVQHYNIVKRDISDEAIIM